MQFMNEEMKYKIAASMISNADVILVCTGAGMGVAAGLGTFRGIAAGVWPPLTKYNKDFTELSNPRWFDKDEGDSVPTLHNAGFGYAFWQYRYKAYSTCTPHLGYEILTKWLIKKREQSDPSLGGGFNVTSNIDGAWLKCPGIYADKVYECHGSIDFMQCVRSCKPRRIIPTNATDWDMVVDESSDCAKPPFPVCTECGGRARPNVLMFGDYGFDSARVDIQEHNFRLWIKKLRRNFPSSNVVVIEIGAGIAVPTIRRISEGTVRTLGVDRCALIRMNPEYPEIPSDLTNDRSKAEARLLSFTEPSVDVLVKLDAMMS